MVRVGRVSVRRHLIIPPATGCAISHGAEIRACDQAYDVGHRAEACHPRREWSAETRASPYVPGGDIRDVGDERADGHGNGDVDDRYRDVMIR